ncbi:MAG: hypothetical protein ACNA8S_09105 [Deferrisomatales bacterium]
MRRFALLSALLLAWPAAGALAAAPRPELLDARSLAMGGALRSLAGPVEAARVNPAALGPVRGFFAGTSYATGRRHPVDAFSLTLVDNVTSPMGGALQYLRVNGPEEREDVSLSLAAGKTGLWWGFTVRYVHGREDDTTRWKDVFTGDLGFLFERPGGLRIAAVGQDLLDTSLGYLERRIALGVSKDVRWGWTLAADVVRTLDRDVSRGTDLHLGAEHALGDTPWRFRLGQLWRGDTGKDYGSVGVGWSWRTLTVGYGVQRARQSSDEILHAVSAEGVF